jgi:putative transposase
VLATEAFRDLDRALRDFTKSRKGDRKGRRLGFPRLKKRGKCKDAFRLYGKVMRCAGSTVTLPRLGTIASSACGAVKAKLSLSERVLTDPQQHARVA